MVRARRLRKPIGIVCFVLLILIAFAATRAGVQAQTAKVLGFTDWAESTDYGSSSGSTGNSGMALNNLACAAWSGYVYCVGGFGAQGSPSGLTSKVFYAPLTENGVGPWTETTDYGAKSGTSGSGGVLINAGSCVANSGYIYCVGGQTYSGGNFPLVSDVFFAPVSSSGVGPWTETTDYGAASGTTGSGGVQLYRPSCVTYLTYVYCVGGVFSAGVSGSETFYAPLSPSGVGPWTETTDYGASSGTSGSAGISIQGVSCAVSNGTEVCVGGHQSSVFYAPLSSSGIGGWTETTDYGAASGSSGTGGVAVDSGACASYSSYILCVGGRNATAPDDKEMSNVYFAPVSPSGVGAWNQTKSYGDGGPPIPIGHEQLQVHLPPWQCPQFTVEGTGSDGYGGSRTWFLNMLTSTCQYASTTSTTTSTASVSTVSGTSTTLITSTSISYSGTSTTGFTSASFSQSQTGGSTTTSVPVGQPTSTQAGGKEGGFDVWENLFVWNEKYSGVLEYTPDYAYVVVASAGLLYYFRYDWLGKYLGVETEEEPKKKLEEEPKKEEPKEEPKKGGGGSGSDEVM